MTVTTPRVLVISESRITRRVVEMTFADQPLEVIVAQSGAEGLASWDARPAAVVVVDLAMEPPDGLAVARRLADGGTGVPVVVMAGQGDRVDDAALASAGVRGVLRKPLDSMQLIDAVRAAIRDGRRPVTDAVPWRFAFEAPVEPALDATASVSAPPDPDEAIASGAPAFAPAVETTAPTHLRDEDLERVAERVAAIWSGDENRAQRVSALVVERVDRVAPAAASEAAERLVRELAPAVVAEVARMVVADVSERLVREEIARMRSAHAAR